MTMSCAAAAETMFAALRAYDLTGTLIPLPVPQAPDVVARVVLSPQPAGGAEDYEMLDAIASRRTVRRPYADTPVPPEVQALMREAARPFGVELSLGQQLVVLVLCILTATGVAGIPGGSLPLIGLILVQVNVPAGAIALVFGVDRILDMCRTVLNVTGDITAATYVARAEGAVLMRQRPMPAEVDL